MGKKAPAFSCSENCTVCLAELVQEDAAQRYRRFLRRSPTLAERLPQYHIASHMGITPTQLSRIRKKNSEQIRRMAMDLLDALNWRYAVRRFAQARIGEEELQRLLKATRMSASSYGLQPYRLIAVESGEVRRSLLPHSMGQEKVVECSHLIVFAAQVDVGEQTVDRYIERVAEVRGVPLSELQRMSANIKGALANKTRQQRLEWAHRQAYIALGNLLTSAATMGIDTCPMEGFEPEGYDRVLGLAGRGLTTSVICTIGRRHAEDDSAHQKKVRFAHCELVEMI